MTAALGVDVTGWLIGRLDAALTARVGAETPADLETQVPFVRVLRVGGSSDRVILDSARMAFHCYDLKTTAGGENRLGYQVIRAVLDLRGQPAAGAVLTSVGDANGPSWAGTENTALRHAVVLMQARIKTTT